MKTFLSVLITFLVLLSACGSPSRLSIFQRFRENDDGLITDIVTGLQWKVGPDRDTDWFEANIWVDNLGGLWRMPLREEMEELYDAGINVNTWGPFDNGGWSVWCVDYHSSGMRYLFSFWPYTGMDFTAVGPPSGERAFAVLSPEGYGTVALRTFRSWTRFGSPLSLLCSEPSGIPGS
ncbi:MAG: hypothetical protein GF388_04210 [Candidatus Aegiribacteria sp.]|nr:hypothetical protein [Candidatus Aegiribacteria sp.]MBD3294443.1 hypothetical protein [Candidatus Fermentibacteria bacterium]